MKIDKLIFFLFLENKKKRLCNTILTALFFTNQNLGTQKKKETDDFSLFFPRAANFCDQKKKEKLCFVFFWLGFTRTKNKKITHAER
jgi:hypothetical protein